MSTQARKLLISAFLLIAAVPFAKANILAEKGKRTIGIDLAVEEYVRWQGKKKTINVLSVENINRRHGQQVANVFQYIGESPDINIDQPLHGINIADFQYMTEEEAEVKRREFLSYIDQNNVQLVMASSSILAEPENRQLVNSLVERGVIISNSAGNSELRENSYDFGDSRLKKKIFLAGSVDENGMYSGFAREGKFITLAIPQGIARVKNFDSGEEYFQDYTSGAQPVQAKVLYLLMSILPKSHYHLIYDILRFSATKSWNAFDPLRSQGMGTMNAYLAVKIATEIVDQSLPPSIGIRELDEILYKIQKDEMKNKDTESDKRLRKRLLAKFNSSYALKIKDQVFAKIFNGPQSAHSWSLNELRRSNCQSSIDCKDFARIRWVLRRVSNDQLDALITSTIHKINNKSRITCDTGDRGAEAMLPNKLINFIWEKNTRGAINEEFLDEIMSQLNQCQPHIFLAFLQFLEIGEQTLARYLNQFIQSLIPEKSLIAVVKIYFLSALPKKVVIRNEEKLVEPLKTISRGSEYDFLPSWYCQNQYTKIQWEFLKKIGSNCEK